MSRIRLYLCAAPLMLAACASVGDRNRDTIASLRHEHIEIKEEKIEGGLEKAMLSYQRFLQGAPESALTPEAGRRLADVKSDKEYGPLAPGARTAGRAMATPAPEHVTRPKAV